MSDDKITAGEAYRAAVKAQESIDQHERECGQRWAEARTAMQEVRDHMVAESARTRERRDLNDRSNRRLNLQIALFGTLLTLISVATAVFVATRQAA